MCLYTDIIDRLLSHQVLLYRAITKQIDGWLSRQNLEVKILKISVIVLRGSYSNSKAFSAKNLVFITTPSKLNQIENGKEQRVGIDKVFNFIFLE